MGEGDIFFNIFFIIFTVDRHTVHGIADIYVLVLDVHNLPPIVQHYVEIPYNTHCNPSLKQIGMVLLVCLWFTLTPVMTSESPLPWYKSVLCRD